MHAALRPNRREEHKDRVALPDLPGLPNIVRPLHARQLLVPPEIAHRVDFVRAGW